MKLILMKGNALEMIILQILILILQDLVDIMIRKNVQFMRVKLMGRPWKALVEWFIVVKRMWGAIFNNIIII